MGNPVDRWPRLQEYQAAIINAEANFKDKRLRGLRVQRHPTFQWDAWPRPGNFGVVFKIEGDTVAYAMKVFYKPQQDRQLRYRLIDQHLRDIAMPRRLVSFAYDEAGIRVSERDYPTLRMDWANGDSLDTYLNRRFSESATVDNGKLSEEWLATLQELHGSALAHGDLQHKNILVQSDGTFRLVDYDGVFVPAMRQRGLTACEAGVSSYQHPKRKSEINRFDERIDDFSALVILLTLACVDADLWERYHEDGRLLLAEADLLCPGESALLTELSSRKGAVGTLVGLVRTAAEQDFDQVPSFGSIVSELGMQWSEGGTDASRSTDQQPLPGGRLAAPGQLPGATGFPDAAAASAQPLTYAQRQIAGLYAAGKSVDEIASALGLYRAKVDEYVKVLQHQTRQEDAGSPATSAGTPARPPARVVASPPGRRRALSPRQQEVLELLRAGLMPAQIAARLDLQPTTVSRHLSSIRGVVGDDEVRELLGHAVAKPTAPPPRTPAPAPAPTETATTTPWWAASSPLASRPRTVMKPVAGRPLPARPGPTTQLPSPSPQPTTPAPKRASTGSNVAAVLGVFFLLMIILAIFLVAIH